MPFWIYGRDGETGQPTDPFFSDSRDESAARREAEALGIQIESVEGLSSKSDDQDQARPDQHAWKRVMPEALAWGLVTSILLVLFTMLSPLWPGPLGSLQIYLFVCGPFVILGVFVVIGITIALKRWILHPYRSIFVMAVCSAVSLAGLWQWAVHLDILPGNESRFYSYPQFWLAIAIGLDVSLVLAFRWRIPTR